MSQWLMESCLGEPLGEEGGEKSRGLKEIEGFREMGGNLHLGTSCCGCALRLNPQALLQNECSSRASEHCAGV